MSGSRDRSLRPFGSSTFGSASNKGKAAIMDLTDDDDDDDIIELVDDRIPPGMRKSDKTPSMMFRSQEIKPDIPSSQRGSSQSSASRSVFDRFGLSQSSISSQPKGTSFQSRQQDLLTSVADKGPKKASALPRWEVQDRYRQELDHLKIAHRVFGAG
jgi:hypothetical protein